MLASIGQNNGKASSLYDTNSDDRVMPLIHCVDQHSFTDIAHYLPYRTVLECGSYKQLFIQIWNEVVGLNSRKIQFDFVHGGSPFFHEVRIAQMLLWKSRSTRSSALPVTDITTTLEYKLHDGWLASFIGSMEIRVNNTIAVVMMNPDDLFLYTAVKRPSRDKNSATDLTEHERMVAINTFRQKLREGIPLKNVPSTLQMFYNSEVRLIDTDIEPYYIIDNNGTSTPWNEITTLNISLPIHDLPLQYNNYHEDAIMFYGNGIRINADEYFDQYINSVPRPVLQRSLIYIGYNTEIDLRHIGRDGNGTEYAVTIEDTGVSELLSVISALYPAALYKNKSKYIVKNGPLMWLLEQRLRNTIHDTDTIEHGLWPQPLPETRDLWEHQTEAIQNLIETRHRKKARIIWISPGLGKTCIIANYISYLINNGLMNKYCLYTLPPSAMATVEKEFNMMGIPFTHIDMRSTSKGLKNLVPGRVNVVYHDHLRMLDLDIIKQLAPEMLFIVDEFHKTLNATIRTSTALEISYLCNDCIAMTGTLIKDTNINPIIVWLSMAVSFEVTTQNYWVAMSSIISRKVQTRIIVERHEIEAPMSNSERETYYSLVPSKLGGTALNIDFKRAVEVSYQPITREIIRLIISHLRDGIGVFVVARNIAHQQYINNELHRNGIMNTFLIDRDHSIDLIPSSPPPVPDVVITTPTHAEGYNMTRFHVMITGVYFSNQSTRDQLYARINRLSQTSPRIHIITVHAGIISYIHTHYENARHLSETLKGFAREIGITYHEMMGL